MLTETQRVTLLQFCERHSEIISAYLFGSFAKETATPSSDIDLALLLKERPTLDWIGQTTASLSERLGREVDLIILNEAPPFLKFQIFRYGQPLFERDKSALDRFLAGSLIEYFDYEPLKRRMEEKILRRLKEKPR